MDPSQVEAILTIMDALGLGDLVDSRTREKMGNVKAISVRACGRSLVERTLVIIAPDDMIRHTLQDGKTIRYLDSGYIGVDTQVIRPKGRSSTQFNFGLQNEVTSVHENTASGSTSPWVYNLVQEGDGFTLVVKNSVSITPISFSVGLVKCGFSKSDLSIGAINMPIVT